MQCLYTVNVCAAIVVISVVLECCTICSNNCLYCQLHVQVKCLVIYIEEPAVPYDNVGHR